MSNLRYGMITYKKDGSRGHSEYSDDFYQILQLYVEEAKRTEFPRPTLWVYDGTRYARVHDFYFSELTPETYSRYLKERIIEDDEILATVIQFGRDISWELMDMERTKAIVYIDGKAYFSDLNHQEAMTEYVKDYWKNAQIDLNVSLGDAIRHTDNQFRENQMFGFDLFESLEHRYLVAHYPQHFNDPDCFAWARYYAESEEFELATFTDQKQFGGKCQTVIFS